MTTVTAQPPPGTQIPADAFTGITSKRVIGMEWVEGGLAVTFDGTLAATEAEQVAKRIAAKDADDWTRRKALLAQVDAAATLAETQAALRSLTRYVLGEPSQATATKRTTTLKETR
jgi:hypothetical protein